MHPKVYYEFWKNNIIIYNIDFTDFYIEQPEVSDIFFSSEVSAFNILPIARFAWVKS